MDTEKAIIFLKELCRYIKPGLTPEELDILNTKKLKEGEMRKWR